MNRIEKNIRLFAQYEKIKLANMIIAEAFELVSEINGIRKSDLPEFRKVIAQHTANVEQTEEYMQILLKEVLHVDE